MTLTSMIRGDDLLLMIRFCGPLLRSEEQLGMRVSQEQARPSLCDLIRTQSKTGLRESVMKRRRFVVLGMIEVRPSGD